MATGDDTNDNLTRLTTKPVFIIGNVDNDVSPPLWFILMVGHTIENTGEFNLYAGSTAV